jgi:hypothetical protein
MQYVMVTATGLAIFIRRTKNETPKIGSLAVNEFNRHSAGHQVLARSKWDISEQRINNQQDESTFVRF